MRTLEEREFLKDTTRFKVGATIQLASTAAHSRTICIVKLTHMHLPHAMAERMTLCLSSAPIRVSPSSSISSEPMTP